MSSCFYLKLLSGPKDFKVTRISIRISILRLMIFSYKNEMIQRQDGVHCHAP